MTKEEMYEDIRKWKKEKNAIILAHYYQTGDIQDIADYVGDSLALSQIAAKTDAKIIVFCGVHFMAETAKILSPDKKVLLPNIKAGCVMADMIDEIRLQKYKNEHPDTLVMVYVNSTAKVKALADVCVTSSNALNIIDHYAKTGKKILYCPDQNLAKYAMKLNGYNLELWPGFCRIHHNLDKGMVLRAKEKYPNAEFIAHPECRLEVLELADYVGSTKALVNYVSKSDKKEFIIGTEEGVIHGMEKANPDKKFYPLSKTLICGQMKMTKLVDLYNCLKDETNEITLSDEIITKARVCLDRMLELS